MPTFGSWALNEEWGPLQSWMQIVPNAGIGANAAGNWSVGTYTMPFAGRLTAEFKARCSWTSNNTWYRATLSQSSPAPNTTSYHAKRLGNPGGYGSVGEMPVTATWDSVTKGTVLNIIVRIEAGDNGTITFISAGGVLRAIPT